MLKILKESLRIDSNNKGGVAEVHGIKYGEWCVKNRT